MKNPSASAVVFLLIALLMSSCGGEVDSGPGPTPGASPTPTLIFAELPPAAGTLPAAGTPTPAAIVTSTPGPSPTPALPAPALPLTLIPTTPDIRWEACADSPPSTLHVGDRAYISYDPYLPTRVRTRPGLYRSSVLGLIIPGEVVEILEGPACLDQAVWWRVSSLRKSLVGWVQEGDEGGNWLIRTELEASVIAPPPDELLCPVNDESFCVFVNDLEPLVTRGDFDQILARTRVYACGSTGEINPGPITPLAYGDEANCVYWAVIGSGIGGVELTPPELIQPSWAAYAAAPRQIAALLLPPYGEVQPALPPSPALLIETADPLWDWLFFMDKTGGTWQISVLVTLSKESGAYPLLLDDPIQWP